MAHDERVKIISRRAPDSAAMLANLERAGAPAAGVIPRHANVMPDAPGK